MSYELSSFLKKLLLYDLFIGIGLSLIVLILQGDYFFSFLIGVIMAIVNVLFNGISTWITFKNEGSNKNLITIGYFLRVIAAAFLGLYTYRFGAGGVLAFAGGYTCQFIGLILYGINIA